MAKNEKTYGALDKYFLNFFNSFNYIAPGDLSKAVKVPAEDRINQLNELCVEIRRASPEARKALIDHDAAKQVFFEAAAQNKWTELNNKTFNEKEFEALSGRVYATRADLRDLERPYTDRLEIGLATALADAVLASASEVKRIKSELDALVATQSMLARNQDNIIQIYRYAACASVAEEYAKKKPKFAMNGLQDELERLKTLVQKLRLELQGVRYPFDRALGPATVLQHIEEDLDGVASTGSYSWTIYALLDAIEKLHVKTLARLAEIAMETESRHGIKLKLV